MSEKVTVRFESSIAMHHEAFVLGKQQLRYNAESATATILSSLDTHPPEVVLRGSFHPHAGPPPTPLLPIKVALSSQCIQARLEHSQTRPLAWAIHSIHGPSAGSRLRTVTLCNRTASPLRFHMNTDGPFEIAHVVTSVPQEPHRYVGSKFFNPPHADDSLCGASFLPPQQSVDVTLQCVLGAAKPPAQDSRATGVLRLCFGNGEVQEEGLVACMLHPRLQCQHSGGAPMHCLDFGCVAVRSCRTLQIVLENRSEVDAVWAAAMHKIDAAPSMVSTAALAKSSTQKHRLAEAGSKDGIVALYGFTATPSSGLLHGSPPERPCEQITICVKFCPDSVGHFESELRFMSKGGDPCSLTMKGTATLDERHEPDWKLTEQYQ